MPAAIFWTENRAALVARKYVEGRTQVAIGKEFGFKTSAPVCRAIKHFIFKYCPEEFRAGMIWRDHGEPLYNCYGNDRLPLVKKALRRWGKSLDEIP